MRSVRIGIIADYNPKNRYHTTTEDSVMHAAQALELHANVVWLDTDKLVDRDAEEKLRGCDALWCGPSSPYRSMEGALRAIQFAREEGRPFVGT